MSATSTTAKYRCVTERYIEVTIGQDRYKLDLYSAERLRTELANALDVDAVTGVEQ